MHDSHRTASPQLQVNDGDDLPEPFIAACAQDWALCGSGLFSWSVFRFYRARLLTQTGTFQEDQPFLLDLHYLRSLSGRQIVSTSIDEMTRISVRDQSRLQFWSDYLLTILPDVTLGDRLLGWFIPGERVAFYSATHYLGQIEDPAFVSQFSAIWLDEKTRSPGLRQALLGATLEARL